VFLFFDNLLEYAQFIKIQVIKLMPKASDLKKGAIIEIDDQLFKVRNIDVRSPSSRGANTLFKVTLMNNQKKQI